MKSVLNKASLLIVAALVVGCGKENVGEQRADLRSQEAANLVGSYSSVCENNRRHNLKLEGEKFRLVTTTFVDDRCETKDRSESYTGTYNLQQTQKAYPDSLVFKYDDAYSADYAYEEDVKNAQKVYDARYAELAAELAQPLESQDPKVRIQRDHLRAVIQAMGNVPKWEVNKAQTLNRLQAEGLGLMDVRGRLTSQRKYQYQIDGHILDVSGLGTPVLTRD